MHRHMLLRCLPALSVSCGPQLVHLGVLRYCLDLLGSSLQRWEEQRRRGQGRGQEQEEEKRQGDERIFSDRVAVLAASFLNYLACYGDPLACKRCATWPGGSPASSRAKQAGRKMGMGMCRGGTPCSAVYGAGMAALTMPALFVCPTPAQACTAAPLAPCPLPSAPLCV